MDLQRELEKSVERYRYVNEATSDAIYDWDITTGKIYRGSRFQNLFGFSEKTTSLRFSLSRIHPDDVEKYKLNVFTSLRDLHSTTWKVEYRLKDASGAYRTVVDKAFIQKYDNRAVRVIGALQDITEQKQLQERLLEQERKAKCAIVKSIIEAQEKERRHLSVELHDNINQMLTSCKLMLEYAKDNKEASHVLIEKSYQSLHQIINEIRRISHELNPSAIEDIGLVEAIEQIIEKITLACKLNIHFEKRVPHSAVLKEEDKITIYRIIQEQINNIIKHAQAKNVKISLLIKEEKIQLMIQDDGKGFCVAKAKKGLGLKNILHRVEYYNGTCNNISEPGKGCRMEITMLIKNCSFYNG
jgi:PAS domain S-box-containing protein